MSSNSSYFWKGTEGDPDFDDHICNSDILFERMLASSAAAETSRRAARRYGHVATTGDRAAAQYEFEAAQYEFDVIAFLCGSVGPDRPARKSPG
jgi:hypothetical protein